QRLFISIIGPVNIDAASKAEGKHYAISAQAPTVVPFGRTNDKDSIEFEGKVWVEADPPQVNDVVHISGTLLPYASPRLHVEHLCTLIRGELPDNFEPACPTVCCLGQVIKWERVGGVITLKTAEYDHALKKRVIVELLVYRHGPRWANAPEPREGSLLIVRGPIYHQLDVSSKWALNADSISILPATGAATGSSTSSDGPKTPKRVYKRKHIFDGGDGLNTDADDADDNNRPEPSSSPSASGSKGKGRAAR
ncbi:hypothetical protein V8E36_005131, partial [Tilletia maclaganii]